MDTVLLAAALIIGVCILILLGVTSYLMRRARKAHDETHAEFNAAKRAAQEDSDEG